MDVDNSNQNSNTKNGNNTNENIKENTMAKEAAKVTTKETNDSSEKPKLEEEDTQLTKNSTSTSDLKDEQQTMVSDNCDKDIDEKSRNSKEPQEEDIPESFFDDLMSEDFIEGLNVVDTWEGDEVNQNSIDTDVKENIEATTVESTAKSSRPVIVNDKKQKDKVPVTSNKQKDKVPVISNKQKHKVPVTSNKQKDKVAVSSNKQKDKVPVPSNKQKDKVPVTNNKQKDKVAVPSNKQRDKVAVPCNKRADKRKRIRKKDRTTEYKPVNPENNSKTNENKRRKRSRSRSKGRKVSDGGRRDPNKTQRDILRDKDKCKKDQTAKILHEKLKVVETGLVPPGMEMEVDIDSLEKNKLEDGEILPEPEELEAQKTSEIKSAKKSENREHRNESIDKKRDRHFKGYPRSRSRKDVSPDYKRAPRRNSRESRRKFSLAARSRSIENRRRKQARRSRSLSPIRKTAPLVKRNQQLMRELDRLNAKLFPGNEAPRNPEHDTSQNYAQNLGQYPPVLNQNYMSLQPVPPPQTPSSELDQQFFIGQSSFGPNNYSMPMQPTMMPLIPNNQHNYQNWHVAQPSHAPMNYYHSGNQFVVEQNSFQDGMGTATNYTHNVAVMPPQQAFVMPEIPAAGPKVDNKNDEEIFVKLLAEKKITLSDYLSVTAKSSDNSNPVDIQNKIKVISHCQEALSEINGNAKATGKFQLRKSHKGVIKPSTAEGLSPFKKVPAIKFQFTTFSKLGDDRQLLTGSLNRLLHRLGKETLFQEAPPPPQTIPKPLQKPQQKPPPMFQRTSNASCQTDPVSASDFGCQVSFEELSPTKSIYKKQSLAQLTPAQLLAQAEKETTPPPAPRWMSDGLINRRNMELHRDFDDMDRRNVRNPGISGWPIPNRNSINPPPPFYSRSPPEQHLHYGNRNF